MKHTYFLTTERLGFSHWKQENIDLALSLWGNRDVTRYLSENGFTEEAIIERLQYEINSQNKDGVQYWPLFLLENDEFIGCGGLKASDPYVEDLRAGVYQLGVHLLPPMWGKGYLTEAMHTLIRYALEELKACNLFAGHHPQNDTAHHVLVDKLGFFPHSKIFYRPIGLMCPVYFLFEQDLPIER